MEILKKKNEELQNLIQGLKDWQDCLKEMENNLDEKKELSNTNGSTDKKRMLEADIDFINKGIATQKEEISKLEEVIADLKEDIARMKLKKEQILEKKEEKEQIPEKEEEKEQIPEKEDGEITENFVFQEEKLG